MKSKLVVIAPDVLAPLLGFSVEKTRALLFVAAKQIPALIPRTNRHKGHKRWSQWYQYETHLTGNKLYFDLAKKLEELAPKLLPPDSRSDG